MTTTTRMATLNPALLRTISFVCARVHHRRLGLGLAVPSGRAWCSGASESTRPYGQSSSADSSALRGVLSVKEPPKYPRLDDPEYCKWKVKEREILNDIEPVVLLAKEILHSDRYMDGEQLTEEDEKVVVERLLAHHPHSEDKIGCGIDSIMMKFSGGPVTGTLVGGGGGLIVRRSRHRLLGPPHRHQAAPLQALRLSA